MRGQPAGRESVASDSRVLRPKMPFSGSAQASGAKLFSTGELRAVDRIARIEARAMRAHDACLRNKMFSRDGAKSRYSSALLHGGDFFARVRVDTKIFSVYVLRARSRVRCSVQGAALTHKIKLSHCYFSPAVVIGCQCWSIRGRTASMIAIHSS